MKLSTALLPVILMAVGPACENESPLGKDFGNAVHYNMAVQIINPSPDYTGRGVPGLSGERAARAMQRYEKGEVIKPRVVPTSRTGGGGK